MPTYYFHLRDAGQTFADEEGADLPNLAAAEERSVAAARDILSFEVRRGSASLHAQIDVIDEDGHTVLVTPFRRAVRIIGA